MTDYESIQKRRSFVVGVFVILAVGAGLWMIFMFGDLPGVVSEIRSFEVRVQFPTAPGVAKDTPVRFCGYQIGRVTDVLAPDIRRDSHTGEHYYQTLVILSIDNQFRGRLPASIEAKLMTRGLGSSYIELKVPPREIEDANTLVQGSMLQGSAGMTSEFFPEESQKKLDELITGIGAFVGSADSILGDPSNQENIRSSLANLAEASRKASETLDEVKLLTGTARNTLEHADANMIELTASLVKTSEQLHDTMTELQGVLAKINNGEGTAGKLVNDGRLYEEMLEAVRQLELIMQDVKGFVSQAREKGVPIKLK